VSAVQPRASLDEADAGTTVRVPRERGHIGTLDGVRGLAILLVVAHNFTLDIPAPSLPLRLLHAITEVGWIGVILFFALSGYLITSILLRTRNDDRYFRNFFARRALRILPLYYTALILTLVVMPRVVTVPPWLAAETKHQVWFWFYLSNWVMPFGNGISILNHFWSLAVEEQFYLVWPLVVWAIAPRRLARLCLVLAAASFASRVAIRASGIVTPIANYSWTTSRLDALALGALVAVALRDPRAAAALARWRARLLPLLALALLALAGVTSGLGRHQPAVDTVGYSLLALAAALLVAGAIEAGDRRGGFTWKLFSHPALAWLGRYSYGIYVFHGMLCLALPRLLPPSWLKPQGNLAYLAVTGGYLVVAALISVALALVSYHVLEKRFLALKSRFASGAAVRSATPATPLMVP
jgi:peptidoglycan/LPS O-acetylase OafA/YrhL